jgi:hypothetical protein
LGELLEGAVVLGDLAHFVEEAHVLRGG